MNVSFSTRGWQQIPWEQQVQMAETMRFGGVELYNVHKTPELTGRGGPLHRYTACLLYTSCKKPSPISPRYCDVLHCRQLGNKSCLLYTSSCV